MKFEVEMSDMVKIMDVLQENVEFHVNRDKMNGAVHLAKEVRYSPLTSETMGAFDRVRSLITDHTIIGGK